LSDESGEVLIEFAISICVLLAMTFGIMEFSRAIYTSHFLSFAAGQATRYAVVRGSTWVGNNCVSVSTQDCAVTSAEITGYVQSIAPPGMSSAALTTTTTWPGTTAAGGACAESNGANSPNCVVKVVVTYPFTFVLPFMPASTLTFTATSEKAILE
jgi:Flp pilus assembly protein TadG